MRRSLPPPIAALLTLVVVAACTGQPGASTPGPSSPADPTTTPDRRSPDGSLVVPTPAIDVPTEVVESLIADASARTGVPPGAITVVQGDRVTWNDGAWGCPEPGVFYTQALVDGWHVIVAAGDARIDYRAVAPDRFRICEGLTGT